MRDLIKLLKSDGWYQVTQKGSHRQFLHREKPGKVTVPGHPKDELAPGTLNNALKQARLKRGA